MVTAQKETAWLLPPFPFGRRLLLSAITEGRGK
jgi:hypothetical protein